MPPSRTDFTRIFPLIALLGAGTLVQCGAPPTTGSGLGQRTFRPLDPRVATVWDRQTTETAALLGEFVAEYNAANDGLDIELSHSGNYADIYRKVTTGIQAGVLPAMAVAYETMTTEYVRKGAAAELDSFIEDPVLGFTSADLGDFFPALMETNRYPEFGGKAYSFPFTKSVLMLYSNLRVLRRTGIAEPPRSWDEFIDQCRLVKKTSGNAALSLDVSASTFVAMVYSMGGEVLESRVPKFDSAESRRALQLIETLVREGLVYQNQPGTFEDQTAFGQDRVAFNLRPSSSLFYVARMMKSYDDWSVGPLPQTDPENPASVLYGANVCIFNTAPDQKEAAWRFIKYFTSTEATGRWAMGTGYLPLRKSAAKSPAMEAFFAEQPHHRAPFDALAYARPEPNLAAWQEMRGLIENAVVSVISQMSTAEEAALSLQADAVTLLSRDAD